MAAPRRVAPLAVPRFADLAVTTPCAALAAIMPLAILTAAQTPTTVVHTMAVPITAPTMAAVASQPGSRSGRRRLRPPRHEATTIPITTRRPISGNEQANAVPPTAIQDEQLPPATKAA